VHAPIRRHCHTGAQSDTKVLADTIV
jgi:hypothetical protein